MIIRLSEKLNKKIKAGTLDSVPLNENPYADWSAHLFTADRTQYIILSNTKSLYSCVMFGKGITNRTQRWSDNLNFDGVLPTCCWWREPESGFWRKRTRR